MAARSQVIHNGKLYYSMTASARLLGTTVSKLRQAMIPEGLEWTNIRVNGPIWISADSLESYRRRKLQFQKKVVICKAV